jgi:aspartate aminotransferase-like enzyme
MAVLNFLPGPVNISAKVRAALAAAPFSHRCEDFLRLYAETTRLLLRHTNSAHAAMLMGSGTLANMVVAHELNKLSGRGLILSNGEFGSRLVRQGKKAGLDFDEYNAPWGQAFDFTRVVELVKKKSWLWLTHCETSTGMINLDAQLAAHCEAHGVKLCLDSVSAVGNMETDFSRVYLASCASGKGFGSFSGIAMVFYNHEPQSAPAGYDYLDLAVYHAAKGPPFTFSSNLLGALHTALSATKYNQKYTANAQHAARMRKLLRETGLTSPVVAAQADYIWTLALPHELDTGKLGKALEDRGVLLHYKNRYLLERNWMQLALMGVCSARRLAICLRVFAEELARLNALREDTREK